MNPLRTLVLFNNRISDHGVSQLAACLAHESCPLQSLDLEENDFSSEGALALAKALRTNRNLRFLKLGGNHFGARPMFPLAASLISHPLSELSIRDAQVGAEGIITLCK